MGYYIGVFKILSFLLLRFYIAGGGSGSVLNIMHGNRMTVDPRIPTMPGRSASGFQRPGRRR